MKKLLIPVILIGAVCLLFRQPEYYGAGEISTEQNTYDLYEKDNYLYIKRDKKYGKIFGEEIIDYKIYNIDSDIDEEILVITKHEAGEFGSDFIIYDTKEADGTLVAKEIYRHDFSNIKPWKVDACNLDNDGQADIFIGVYKDTVFYKDVRRRPFFYSWDGNRLHKKWLGSFFTEWDLVDITFGDYYNLGYDVAAVLEKNQDAYRIGIYQFIGFGFENMKTIDSGDGSFRSQIDLLFEK
jgi:hypothetical protein